jgi:hypothetical protein
MKPHPLPLALAAAFTAVSLSSSAHAQLISSESFWTVNTAPAAGEYRRGNIGSTSVSGYNNTVVVTPILGNATWSGSTGDWSTGFSPAVTTAANVFFAGAGGVATNNIANASLDTLNTIPFPDSQPR